MYSDHLINEFDFIRRNIPESSDKSVELLRYHFEYLVSGGSKSLLEDWKRIYENFNSQLSKERHNSKDISAAQKKLKLTIEKNNPVLILKEIKHLLHKLRPLNLGLVIQLMEKSNVSAKLIENSSVILLLGGTGVGKSTTVQFLCGSKLEKTKVEGIDHIEVKCYKCKEMESFTTSPAMKSETKCINTAKIDPTANNVSLSDETVVICDTPGFGDTAGVEVDIVNCIAIANAMRSCKSLRPVILIAQPSMGDRLEGVLKLTKLLLRIFPSIESHLESFSYVFTKFDKDECANIIAKIKNVLTNNMDDADASFVALLSHMYERVKMNIMVLDPVHDDCGEVLASLMAVTPIENPSAIVSDFLTPDAVQVLRSQLVRHETSIRNGLHPLDEELVRFKYLELAALKSMLKVDELDEAFDRSTEEIVKAITSAQAQMKKKLAVVASSVTIVEEDIRKSCDLYNDLKKWESLRSALSAHLLDSFPTNLEEDASLLIVDCAGKLKDSFIESFTLKSSTSNMLDCAGTDIMLSFKKLHYLQNCRDDLNLLNLPMLRECLDVCSQHADKELEIVAETIRCSINSLDLMSYTSGMNFLKYVQQLGGCEFWAKYSTVYSESQSTFLTTVMCQFDDCLSTLKGNIMANLRNVQTLVGAINPSSLPRSLLHHIDTGKLSEVYGTLEWNVSNTVSHNCDVILSKVDSPLDVQVDFATVSDILRFNEEITNMPFANNSSGKVSTTESQVKAVIEGYKNTVLAGMDSLLDMGMTNHIVCESALINLQNSDKHLTSFRTIYDNEYLDVITRFDDVEKKLFVILSTSKMTVEDHSCLRVLLSIASALIATSSLLHKPLGSSTHEFFSSLRQELENVVSVFSVMEKQEFMSWRDSLSFLCACSSKLDGVPIAEIIKDAVVKIESYISNWKEALLSDLVRNFSNAKSFEQMQDVSDNVNKIESILRRLHAMRNYYALKPIPVDGFNLGRMLFEGVLDNCSREGSIELQKFQEYANDLYVKFSSESDMTKMLAMNQVLSLLTQQLNDIFPAEVSSLCALCTSVTGFIEANMRSTSDQITYAINNKNYVRVATLMESLDHTTREGYESFEKAKFELAIHIDIKLTQAERMLEDSVRGDDCIGIKIVDEIKSLDFAEQKIFKYLVDCDECDDNQCPKRVRKVPIRDRLDAIHVSVQMRISSLLKVVSKYAEGNDFEKAVDQLVDVRRTSSLFGVINCHLCRLHHPFEEHMKLLFDSCTIEIMDHITSTILSYDNPNSTLLELCLKTPPRPFLSTLRKCSETNEVYQPLCHQFIECLSKRVHKDLKKAADDGRDALNKAFIEIEKLECTLPESLPSHYQVYLQELRNRAKKEEEGDDALIKETEIYPHFETELEYLLVLLMEGSFNKSNILRDRIRGNFLKFIHKVKKCDMIGPVLEAVSVLPQINSEWDRYFVTMEKWVEIVSHENYDRKYLRCKPMFENVLSGLQQVFTTLSNAIRPQETKYYYDVEQRVYFSVHDSISVPQSFVKYNSYANTFHNERGFLMPYAQSGKFYDNKSGMYLVNKHQSVDFVEEKKQLLKDKDLRNNISDCMKSLARKTKKFLSTFDRFTRDVPETLRSVSTDFDTAIIVLNAYNGCTQLKKECVEIGVDPFTAIESYATVLKSHQRQFEQYLSSDFSKLCILMKVTRDSHEFLDKIYRHARETSNDSLQTSVEACFRFDRMCHEVLQNIIDMKRNTCVYLENEPATKSMNGYDRDVFYKDCSRRLSKLRSVKSVLDLIITTAINLNSLEDCREHFISQLDGINNHLEHKLSSFPNEADAITKQIDIYFDNFRAASEHFEDHAIQAHASSLMDKCRDVIEHKLAEYSQTHLMPSMDDIDIISKLIVLKSCTLSLPSFKKSIDKVIEGFLFELKSGEGAGRIARLGIALNQHENKGISQMIINETKTLKGYALLLRNEKTLKMTHTNILDAVEGNDLDKSELLRLYELFELEYWGLVENGILDMTEFLRYLPQLTLDINKKEMDNQDKVRSLIAHVCAYWTLDNERSTASGDITDYDESKDGMEASLKDNYNLLRPHAAQIIAIFRLLCLDDDVSRGGTSSTPLASSLPLAVAVPLSSSSSNHSAIPVATSCNLPEDGLLVASLPKSIADTLSNQLVQIFTGEGKSLVLAITAIVLAIMGCTVDCACYSEYLSKRDFQAFTHLFKTFGVLGYVSYGTFHGLCENFINQHGSVRDLVNAAISKEPSVRTAKKVPDARPKVLLIDEVDMFFTTDFYGNMYKPLTKVVDHSVTDIMKYIWQHRDDKDLLRFANIETTEQYRKLLAKFGSEWRSLLEQCVLQMLQDIKTHDTHEYELQDGKIGYKDQDSISFGITYGYKTLFAYFKESSSFPPKVTNSVLESRISLIIDSGNFSYAEIPKLYRCVMGVSGTLKTLLTPERSLLEDVYGIKRNTYIPSVYGQNQLVFKKDSLADCAIESHSSYYMTLTTEITDRLYSLDGSQHKRAVLVFFETTNKLLTYYNSTEFRDLKEHARILTEQTSSSDKEGIIRSAVTSGTITLLSKSFGRGTDFYCYDDRLIRSGGVHVIQTFLSEILSEETQIMGRTARQGNKGSFSMRLLDTELEKFGVKGVDIERMKATGMLYSTLNTKRQEFFQMKYPESMRYVDTIRASHVEAMSFIDCLISGDVKKVATYLFERNKAPVANGGHIRTMILMDATGSMTNLLTKAKNTTQTMIERMDRVLEKMKCRAVLDFQFVVYRNYNVSAERIIQSSGWQTNPDHLRQFMNTVRPEGGMGNEAIELGFERAVIENSREPIHQVILIGDMPPNNHKQVNRNRKHFGEQYWATTRYRRATYHDVELQKLRDKNVPVHAFYVHHNAAARFSEISRMTGGNCAALDIDSEKGSEQLSKLVAEVVLRLAGGERGEEFVDEYHRLFTRGFLS